MQQKFIKKINKIQFVTMIFIPKIARKNLKKEVLYL